MLWSDFNKIILQNIFTGIQEISVYFNSTGKTILAILIAFEIFRASFDFVMNRGFNLDKVIIALLSVLLLWELWPRLLPVLNDGVLQIVKGFYKGNALTTQLTYNTARALDLLWSQITLWNALTAIGQTIVVALIYIIAYLCAIVSQLAIDLYVIGTYTILSILLNLGSLFIPCLMAKGTRNMGIAWMKRVGLCIFKFINLLAIVWVLVRINRDLIDEFIKDFTKINDLSGIYLLIIACILIIYMVFKIDKLIKNVEDAVMQ